MATAGGVARRAGGEYLDYAQRILGDDHLDTLASRNNLAGTYQAAGRTADAIPLFEQNLADRLRILGDDHPLTVAIRQNSRRTHSGQAK